ncbi:hypothetical protein Plec18167_003419 [Paecilomyces lecythidis]|uniref:Uncharacterized protein n=1 Tax=Paecilomyces lecythidis TaxID=3004212 RepID=A0ABR3XY22_9EURO
MGDAPRSGGVPGQPREAEALRIYDPEGVMFIQFTSEPAIPGVEQVIRKFQHIARFWALRE